MPYVTKTELLLAILIAAVVLFGIHEAAGMLTQTMAAPR